MKIYFFGGDFKIIDDIYESRFDGTLFLYNSSSSEFFTLISKHYDKLKPNFGYMVAIRPYVISPQYLAMINRSIYRDVTPNLEINLISGWTKDEEKPFNSFVGEINDQSRSIDKSNYLIKYLEAIDKLKNNSPRPEEDVPNIYVSTTNRFVFEAASKYGNKMILPYSRYKRGRVESWPTENPTNFDLKDKKYFVSLGPIIRDTQEELNGLEPTNQRDDMVLATPKGLIDILIKIKEDGAEGVLLFAWEEERRRLLDFIKKNKDLIV